MPTRFKTNSKSTFGQVPLPSGYENIVGTPTLNIPSCGIEDVDTALFNLFDKEIFPESSIADDKTTKKVPVIFAAGEKWALLKNGRPLRDRSNTLILPLVTIMRTEINQSLADDVVGRGINQQSGEIIVKRRLDKSDRQYQSLINKINLKNQQNVATTPGQSTLTGHISTDREIGSLQETKEVKDGAYLSPNMVNNVYETIVVPSPQFYTMKYEITIWTQFTQHSNQILEKIFSTFLPQAQSWRLDTPKGYWFIAKVEDGSIQTETNFDDMSQQERFIKHTFTVSVPAYLFALRPSGAPIPIKRYVSAPIINFDLQDDDLAEIDSTFEGQNLYVLGSDDPTLPLDNVKNFRKDQRSVGWRSQKIYPVRQDDYEYNTYSDDPALNQKPNGDLNIKVLSKNSKGETVYTGASLGGLKIEVIK
jgi:hypothetical protein